MWDQLKRVSDVVPPVTLEFVKAELRIDGNEEDGLLYALIQASTQDLENETGNSFAVQSFDYFLSSFESEIVIPVGPLIGVTSIKYIDTEEAEQTFPGSSYRVDTVLGRVKAVNEWPSIHSDVYNPVTIRFTAGDSSPAENIQLAVALLAAHRFENREGDHDIPDGVRRIVDPIKRGRFG